MRSRGKAIADDVRAVGSHGTNVLDREMRISVNRFGFGGSFTKFLEEKFNRNARTPTDRFADHDLGIDLESVG